MLIEIIKAIFIGIVEGVTEWLPISSTGHMILVDEFIKLNVTKEFMDMFLVVIQLGAIMAVVVLYFFKLLPISSKKDDKYIEKSIDSKDIAIGKTGYLISRPKIILWLKIIIACLPAAIIGIPLDDIITSNLYNPVVVALMLIIYGIAFIVVENNHKDKMFRVNSLEKLSYKDAILIGLFQVLSIIPGTSRSGATIIGAILIGTNRTIAAEFTFFLAIPVMFGASLLKIIKFGVAFQSMEIIILMVGMLVAFAVSVFAIKFLMGYIKKHDFKAFGYYRIVLGIIVLLYFAIMGIIK